VLRTYKPRVLVTTHEDDPHPDHANTSIIVRQSARLATMKRYDEESGLPAMPMPAIMHSLFSRRLVPSFVVDVSDFVDDKMSAIRAYTSQFYNAGSDEPSTRISAQGFLDEIELRMRYFGTLIGVAAGEPYYVREALNVDDPLALLTRPMNIYS
jgi:LmbE family N-acetylglucosaminyl deacetylase